MSLHASQNETNPAHHLPQQGEVWTSNGFRVRVLRSDSDRTEYVKPPHADAPAKCNTEWFLKHFRPTGSNARS